MNRIVLTIFLTAALAGGGVWWLMHDKGTAPAAPAEKPPDEEAGASGVTHDEQGNSVVKMADDDQGDAGIVVANPAPGQWSPEVKAYGRVLDPAPLVTLINELASAQSAATASAQELDRQKILSAQTNTSARALQTAEAASRHDQLALQAARQSLALDWGEALAQRDDLPALAESLVTRQAAIVRVDLPGGEALSAPPIQARLITLSAKTAEAKYVGPAMSVDAQLQGQGHLFSVQPNAIGLVPGEACTAWLQMPGDPLNGVIIPRDAVVRAEGAGWVYVINKGGESFTRRKISLDRPTGDGWFVGEGIKPGEFVVVTGAQTLRSEELKASLSPD